MNCTARLYLRHGAEPGEPERLECDVPLQRPPDGGTLPHEGPHYGRAADGSAWWWREGRDSRGFPAVFVHALEAP